MRVFEDGEHLHGAVMTALAKLWPTGTAVLSGCEISGSPSALVVSVGAGSVSINGVVVSVGADTASLSVAGGVDRYDLVCVDTSGNIVVVDGTDERVVPTIPADSVPIAICLVEVDQTTLPADRVQDIRVLATHVVADRLTARLVGRSNLFIIVTPSAVVRASSDAVFTSPAGGAPVKLKEFEMGVNLHTALSPATFRVSWEMRTDFGGLDATIGQVRVNGEGVPGGAFSTSSTVYEPFTVDVELKAGDLLQLWGYSQSDASRPGRYQLFRIGADYEEIELTPELVITQTL